MSPRLARLASLPWLHPFLFAAFPVVFLWAHNLDEGVTVSQGLGILAAVSALAALMFLGLRLLLKDAARAAVPTTVFITLFTTFGRVESALRIAPGSKMELFLLIGWVDFEFLAIALVALIGRPLGGVTRTLNLVGAVLIVMNLVPILSARVPANASDFRFPAVTHGLDPTASGSKRDVYYLIFDRYAGGETLKNLYGFDDSPMFQWLARRGFTVTTDALANYPQTTHSLASSLNMSYLDGFAAAQGESSPAWSPLRALLQASAVARTFQAMNYKYEHIGSWWEGTAFDPSADQNHTYGLYTEFSDTFLSSTALPALARQLHIGPSADPDRQQWERVHFQIDALRRVASDSAPTFTFAHFTLPHPPYLFHADGSFVVPDPNRPVPEAYIDQLKYTNHVIQQIVTMLQAAPGPSPIIVVQSDEGPHPPTLDNEAAIDRLAWSVASKEELGRKLRILNAYYLPGQPPMQPYPTITPVNTFRLILDDYFGANLELLPDRTYVFEDFEHPYRFEDVTDRLRDT
jgi:hypothetical protein